MQRSVQAKIKMTDILFVLGLMAVAAAHEVKDFDDSILYKIDYEFPNLLEVPVSKSSYVNYLCY